MMFKLAPLLGLFAGLPGMFFSRRKLHAQVTPIAPTPADLATPLVFPAQMANGDYSGVAILIAGTVTVPAPWVRNNSGGVSKIFPTLKTPNTTALTTGGYYCSAIVDGVSFTLQANVAAGTINVADISTLNWSAIP